MDPQDIEANIKSLLGLNLGGEVSQGAAAPDNAGPPLTRPPLGGEVPLGNVVPPGLVPLMGPPGGMMPPMPPMPPPMQHQVPDQDIGGEAQVQSDAAGIITIENDSPSPLPSVLRAEKDAEDQLREEAAFEAIWQGPEEYKPSPGTVEYLETRHLHPLKSKSAKFPRARWFCRLCEYHCDNLVKCREHYTDTRHSRLARSKEVPQAHHLSSASAMTSSP